MAWFEAGHAVFFHKAKQITLQLSTYNRNRVCHLFDHMIYMCGLLSGTMVSTQKLFIEVHDEDDLWGFQDYACISF